MNFLPVFFLISFHTMCVPSLSNWTSHPRPSLKHKAFLKEKNANKQTMRSVFYFSQAFIQMAGVWWHVSVYFITNKTQPIYKYLVCSYFVLTWMSLRLVSKIMVTLISYQLLIFNTATRFVLVQKFSDDWELWNNL